MEGLRMSDQIKELLRNVLQEELNPLKEEFGSFKKEFNSFKGEFGRLKGEFGSLKEDFSSFKGEFGSLKEDFSSFKGEFGSLKEDLSSFKGEVRTMFSSLKESQEITHAELVAFKLETFEKLENLDRQDKFFDSDLNNLTKELAGNKREIEKLKFERN
jgi:chromosome segregation ATPase